MGNSSYFNMMGQCTTAAFLFWYFMIELKRVDRIVKKTVNSHYVEKGESDR